MPNINKEYAITLEIVSRLHDMKNMVLGNQKEIAQDMTRASAVTKIDWTRVYSSPTTATVMADPAARARLVRMVENVTKLAGGLSPERQQAVMEAAARKAEAASDGS